MLNHRLQVDDSFRIRTHQPSGTGNGTGRQPAKASGSGRCGFLHHHRDRVSTTAVRQNAPGAYADRLGVPPVPCTSLESDAPLYRVNLHGAVG